MRSARNLLLFLAALTGLGSLLSAQTVRWEPAESGLSNAIMLVFENCEPDGPPALPAIPGVSFTPAGRSVSTNIVNFQMTQTTALTYVVRGPQNPPIQIPPFTVQTNKGDQRVPAFNVAAPAAPLDSVASARLVPAKKSVWAGEVFGLNYELSASRRANPQISPTFDWSATPLVAEDWSKPEVTESVAGGERRVNVIFRTRAIAKSPNTVKLEAASHLISIQTGTIGFGIISQPRMEQVSVTSDQPVIEVRPLPAAPAGFGGAVGQFKLVSKVVPEKAAVGEPVTWTLELSGTGNWPDLEGLPARLLSNDFQVVQPKAKRTPAEGKLFDLTLTEDVVLVPSKTGNYTLGPINFVYFDPQAGTYRTITAPRTTLTITAPAAPQFTTPGQAATATEAPPAQAAPPADRKPVAPAAAPASLPRDPLPGRDTAAAPLPAWALVANLLAPLVALTAIWVWLAWRRARETDPLRPRREARTRLQRTLAELTAHSGPGPDRDARLLAWQRDAAVLWDVRHAAPSARTLASAVSPVSAVDAADWTTLWTEADRALYGSTAALPSDWVARAQAALTARKLAPFRPLRLFLPQNLMPFAAALLVAGLTVPVWLHAAAAATSGGDGATAYRKGDFTAAEKSWRQVIEQTPMDWIARHNLSLALAQQERGGEAAAQAAAAFVQQPGDPSVRWHFALAAEKLGAVPAPLTGFTNPGLLHVTARAASPAQWQRVLIGAVWVLALALAGLLARAYGRVPLRLQQAALALLALAILTGATATAGILAYGDAARREAAVVAKPTTLRSIPTEADTTQKTSPLAAGALGLVDRTFLGWRRLAFENGQTGWVRKEEIVPLWR
jgi:hypothetical protein